MKQRRCVFCGKAFEGQKRNFEHIIPQWWVREADLKKRSSIVTLNSKTVNAAMSRIGGQSCEECNDKGSILEGKAHAAYQSLKGGGDLSNDDARTLLDWMDKVRVGLWLWLLDIGKNDYSFSPKFRINQRVASKDRILLLSKYHASATMKGLAIWGATDYFIWSPSAIGFLSNNISMLSVSSDILLARHLVNVSVKHGVNDGELEKLSVELSDKLTARLSFLGNPFIIGQCIAPTSLFQDLGLSVKNESPSYLNIAEGPIYRIDSQLRNPNETLGSIPIYPHEPGAHLALMKINLARASKFMLEDVLTWSLDEITDVDLKNRIPNQVKRYISMMNFEISQYKSEYEAYSGVRLPF